MLRKFTIFFLLFSFSLSFLLHTKNLISVKDFFDYSIVLETNFDIENNEEEDFKRFEKLDDLFYTSDLFSNINLIKNNLFTLVGFRSYLHRSFFEIQIPPPKI